MVKIFGGTLTALRQGDTLFPPNIPAYRSRVFDAEVKYPKTPSDAKQGTA